MRKPAPRISATVRRDGSGEVVINGRSYPIQETSLHDAGALAVQVVADRAAQAGRALRMTAQSPAGTRLLLVHPDGHLTEEGATRLWPPQRLAVAIGIAVVVFGTVWAVAANSGPGGAAPTSPASSTSSPDADVDRDQSPTASPSDRSGAPLPADDGANSSLSVEQTPILPPFPYSPSPSPDAGHGSAASQGSESGEPAASATTSDAASPPGTEPASSQAPTETTAKPKKKKAKDQATVEPANPPAPNSPQDGDAGSNLRPAPPPTSTGGDRTDSSSQGGAILWE
jgi:hypothetical protein